MNDILNFLALVSTTASTKVMIQSLTIVWLYCWKCCSQPNLRRLRFWSSEHQNAKEYSVRKAMSSVWESDRLASTDLCECREQNTSALFRHYIYWSELISIGFHINYMTNFLITASNRITALNIITFEVFVFETQIVNKLNICRSILKFIILIMPGLKCLNSSLIN